MLLSAVVKEDHQKRCHQIKTKMSTSPPSKSNIVEESCKKKTEPEEVVGCSATLLSGRDMAAAFLNSRKLWLSTQDGTQQHHIIKEGESMRQEELIGEGERFQCSH